MSDRPGAVPLPSGMACTLLPLRTAIQVFVAFAVAYFLSALLRAVTATLAPTLIEEFTLSARDLGLLSGGYFLGFAVMQLPLGAWLDRHGPRRVILSLLGFAVAGCLVFALAEGFAWLMVARVLGGIGVSACLMAPLTGYRQWFVPAMQMRVTSWMLMTGSLGMVAATLPVQWLLPLIGWRWVFVLLAALFLLAVLWLAAAAPRARPSAVAADAGMAPTPADALAQHADAHTGGYAAIWHNRLFRRLLPMGFVNYGGLVAVQTLWAGPWMVQVAGYTAEQAAGGLFAINGAMLVAFWLWGWLGPRLARHGWSASRLMVWGMPSSLLAMAAIVALGPQAGAWAWASFCVGCTFVALSQPAIGLAFAAHQVGRALSAYNLVIFSGVFVVQWGIGLGVDGFLSLGLATPDAYRATMAVFGVAQLAAWLWFVLDNRRPDAP